MKTASNLNRRPSTSAKVLREFNTIRCEICDSSLSDSDKFRAMNRLLHFFTGFDYWGKSSEQIERIMLTGAYQVLIDNGLSFFPEVSDDKQ